MEWRGLRLHIENLCENLGTRKNVYDPLHIMKFIPDSDMLFPYSYQNSIP